MQIVNPSQGRHYDASPHRPGGVEFVSLLQGERGAPDNFELSIVRSDASYHTPRHRHNFDQIRVMLEGEFGFDRGLVQKPGSVGYFCEGTYYRQQGVDRAEHLLLQVGGASASGYVAQDQLRAAVRELQERGEFKDGVYHWRDEHGRRHSQDAYEAAWEYLSGRSISYPKPRFETPLVLQRDRIAWNEISGSPRAALRSFGEFNERGLRAGECRVASGATLSLPARPAARLIFVLKGNCALGGEPLETNGALKLDPGEYASLKAAAELRLIYIQLPCFASEVPLT